MPVTVSHVSVHLGNNTVLREISCVFPPHALSVIIGPSGAGKTTLMNVIAGTLHHDTGEVRVHGSHPHPSLTVWVPQGANALTARTVLANTMIAPLSDGISRARATALARRALTQVGLAGREHSQAFELSGGELQRLAIARALASTKQLLLADEPTANLDSATAAEIIDLLRELKLRQTVIVATHDHNLTAVADHVVDLRHPAATASSRHTNDQLQTRAHP